ETPGVDHAMEYEDTLDHYLDVQIASHRANPRDDVEGDLIDYLINADIDGRPLSDDHVRGSIALLLIAGIDTTWSAIGATLWHLAQHPEHRQRLRDEPEIMPFAIEEFLRFYAPVTMARIVARDHELGGCPVKKGEWMLLPFPAANRDPEMFAKAGEVVLDRKQNRHGAFGLGIHRCLGSNLARMELTVAVQAWLDKVPEFELADPAGVRWSTGQIRGPRELPIRILPRRDTP
ncbi:MAG: cytochrome P450, partial [Acidimicrobiales bacterium]